MANPFDVLPSDPKMLVIAALVLALWVATVILLAAVASKSLFTGEPPVR